MMPLPGQFQTCPSRSASTSGRLLRAAFGAALLLTLVDCSEGSIPVLRGSAPSAIEPPAGVSDPVAAECEQLRAQIRANQQAVREAPTTSTSPEIVAAAEAKADKRIDDTRARLDELDCPSDSGDSSNPRRLAPLPPAPGAANPAPGSANP
jgi:hypothetical protein